MENLEQQCEDEVLTVCDARERYSVLCADELEKCIKLTNDLQVIKVHIKTDKQFKMPSFTEQQEQLLDKCLLYKNLSTKSMDRMQKMLDQIENLASIQEQIEREKSCAFIALLRD